MRRTLPVAPLAALVVAACLGAGPPPVPTNVASAEFPAGAPPDRIEVTTIDRLPLREAELVAPDGHATPALSVIANPRPTATFSQQFPRSAYAGPNLGVNSIGSNALTPGVVGGAPETRTQLLAIVSNATIQLPDPAAYRRDWRQYRVRLQLGSPPETETREIAAPAPPRYLP
jgi:hypothetical protein